MCQGGIAAACELAGKFVPRCIPLLWCAHTEEAVTLQCMLCPVLQIRPELIGRDAEAPTAAGVIGAVLPVVLPVLFL